MSKRVPKQSEAGPREREWLEVKQFPTLREARYSQSLERGLAILARFTPERPLLGIAELADDIGMSRSTTHRYAITLRALGFLEQDASHKYRLGLRVTDLGMAALNTTGLRGHVRPYLEALRHRTTFTTSVAVLDGSEILYVDRARSFRRGQYKIDLNLRPGSRLPAYCTSMGKVLLAHIPASEQSKAVGKIALPRSGLNSITSKKALRTELERVHDHGMAINDEECAPGLVSIACPIRSENQEVVAAINLAAHISMISLKEMITQLLPHLSAAADAISARLAPAPGNGHGQQTNLTTNSQHRAFRHDQQ